MSNKTFSEQLFEKFCDSNAIEWSPVIPDDQVSYKNPDYRIKCRGNAVIVEVKEIGQSHADRTRFQRLKLTGTTGTFNPQLDERVRKKIDRAMPQLQRLAKGRLPAIVVLYDNGSIIPLEGLEIRLAMFGQDIVDVGLADDTSNPVAFVRHRFGAGQKVSARHNTTLSAVALLTSQSDLSLYLAFYHNRFAAKPFDPNWLRTSAVSHYRLGDHPIEGGLRTWEPI